MKQEKKDLLLKDLCARLSYGVKASYYGVEEECETWDEIESITIDGYVDIGQYNLSVECIKPYLFPLSSMTEEDKSEFRKLTTDYDNKESMGNFMFRYEELLEDLAMIGFFPYEIYDWLNKNHFDYRGLIPMGLAIDATNKNIY